MAVVYPRATLDTVPSLFNAAELLDRHGFGVDLFVRSAGDAAPPRFTSQEIRLHSLGAETVAAPPPGALRQALRRSGRLGRAVRTPLVHGYQAVRRVVGRAAAVRAAARARRLVATTDRGSTLCYIGVDPDGLFLADDLAAGTAPVAYYSLELLPSAEIRTEAERRTKARERELSRRACFVVVQDAERAALLAADNGVARERLVLVPNAPLGPARRRRSGYWHARLGLRADQRVALHAGSLGGWTGIQGIVDSVPTWPAAWVLVVHTRYDADGESSAYVRQLQARAAPGRVFFSLKPVPRQEYDDLVDGADAALAFYLPTDESALTGQNVRAIGLSSGKVAYALRAGVPVIVNTASSLGDLVERERCGVAVAGAGGIAAALAAVELGREGYSREACRFFDERLDFAQSFARVLDRIDALRHQEAGP